MQTLRLLLFFFLFISCALFTAQAEDPEAQARRLINALGCKACHSFEQSGSDLAPPLERIGARLDPQQIRERLTAHRDKNEKPFMPNYTTIPEEDLNAILKLLAAYK